MRQGFRWSALLLASSLLTWGGVVFAAPTLPPILNSAAGSYTAVGGTTGGSSSNPTTVTPIIYSAITVSPKETVANPATESQPIGQNATRTFTITNSSNITDAYIVSSLTAGSQKIVSAQFIGSGAPTPLGVNGTVSPMVVPGGTIQVQVVIATTGMTVGSSVPVVLTARTTVAGTQNGIQSDSGKQFIIASSPTSISGPGGPNTQVQKTVNLVTSVQSNAGAIVQFEIAAMNSGAATATNVKVSDLVPAGLTPIAGSETINGSPAGSNASLSGQTVTFSIAQLTAGSALTVAFTASVDASASLGNTYVNVATIAADGIPPLTTTPASVLDGQANIVFDGALGGSDPIQGAIVSLLDSSGHPVVLKASPQRLAASTNPFTANPSITDANGTYGFALAASQVAPAGSTFTVTIAANGYLNRKIGLFIVPDALTPQLYNVTATSLDQQPLAKAGGFTLTGTNVTLANVFGLFGNLPLFKNAGIVVNKSGSRSVVSPGDRIDFTVGFTNATQSIITPANVVDTLPSGVVYAPNTARVDGTAVEPLVNGRTLTWTIPTLPPGASHTITYTAIIFPGTNPGQTLMNLVNVSGPSGATSIGGSGSFSFQVVAGPFADRRVLTGRVFADVMHSGVYQKGDHGIAGVRIYLEDGSFVVTDADGRFNFPAIRPGMHALRIDASSIPSGYALYPESRMNSTRSPMRLVHGIMDTTMMQNVDFALEVTP